MPPAVVSKLQDRSARVALVGAGYAGLPLGIAFAERGLRLLVVDIDPSKVEKLNRGESYIPEIPSASIAAAVEAGRLHATTDASELSTADAIVICVPTPLTRNREPELGPVVAAGRALAPHLRRGQLVSLESTTYPGTTEEVLQPILEAPGLKAGADFHLVYSPERVDPGNAHYGIENTPKVVGGIDADSLAAGVALYGSVAKQVVPVASTRVAEATKLLENIYRCVNIALVNELKTVLDAMEINVWDVIDAAKTKPFGYHAFYPGPGLGGHCIPIDPFYLSWKAREYDMNTRFIELAGEVNTAMPRYVAEKVIEALNAERKPILGSRVLVLGVAYKRDVDDVRESPALKLIELLQRAGAHVSYHDPHVPTLRLGHHGEGAELCSRPLDDATLRSTDCALLVTDHSAFDYARIAGLAPLVVDTRNAFRGQVGNIRRA